jgi:hypothetical protein
MFKHEGKKVDSERGKKDKDIKKGNKKITNIRGWRRGIRIKG